MDEFAQSRGEVDLFDDEIVPVETPSLPDDLNSQLQTVSLDSPPPTAESRIAQTRDSRGSSRAWSRGAAGPRRDTKKGGLLNSRYASQPQEEDSTVTQVESDSQARPEDVAPETESKISEDPSNIQETP